MRNTLLTLLLLAVAMPCFGQGLNTPAFYGAAEQQKQVGGGGGGGISIVLTNQLVGDSGGISATSVGNTTGSSLIVVLICYYSDPGITPIHDEKNNTWTGLTLCENPPANYNIKLYYCYSPSTDATHTFDTTANYSTMTVVCVSGTTGSAVDAQNCGVNDSAASIQTGSITPAANGELLVTACVASDNETLSVNSGFTKIGQGAANGAIEGAAAFLIQSTAAAINPTWSKSSAATVRAKIAAFQ